MLEAVVLTLNAAFALTLTPKAEPFGWLLSSSKVLVCMVCDSVTPRLLVADTVIVYRPGLKYLCVNGKCPSSEVPSPH